jgi:hypothetical protein
MGDIKAENQPFGKSIEFVWDGAYNSTLSGYPWRKPQYGEETEGRAGI